jgi:2-desacetyl-2-hydroxyethyl bacteriochlorophyllide A dehydrogenase
MVAQALYFTGPRTVAWRPEPLPRRQPGQVLVQTLLSAISAGTELLIYRGEAPAELAADATLPALRGTLSFPLRYGYACVGRVVAAEADSLPPGTPVFAFHPHQTHFLATPAELIPLPTGMDPADAVFLPHLETAVNFLHDGAPRIGEKVVVLGQGIVGLLTTALLARTAPAALLVLDRYPLRRQTALSLGATAAFDPADPDLHAHMASWLGEEGADLVYELSGQPEALNLALNLAGFGARVIIGSWYGRKTAPLDLGGRFHRSRIRLLASQVSTIAAELSARWNKARRLHLALELAAGLRPSQLISHRFPYAEAAVAFALLDRRPETALQVVLTYEEELPVGGAEDEDEDDRARR